VADGGAAAVAHGFCWNLDPDAERQREICAGVQQLELSNVAVNAGGDEQVSPGERASINVSLTNTGSMPVSLPCVGLVADVPVSSSGDNPLNSFFSIAPGQTLPHPAPDVEFDEGSAVGTVIEFTVYAAAVGADCTEADNLSFSITLE
jgi:hypothetical protein